MTAFRITYEGPVSLAMTAAASLADADGVELTSSDPPERGAADDAVVLALTVEGTSDAVLDAVAQLRDQLGSDARVELGGGGTSRS